MTAELGAPRCGPVVWVDRAFGPFVAHQNALVHLVANFFDNALYPVMFADYLKEFHPALRSKACHATCCARRCSAV